MMKAIKYVNSKKILPAIGLGALLSLSIIIVQPADAVAYDPLPPALPEKSEQVPIDGGLVVLAAAGGGYAIKKLRDKKK